MQVHLFKIVHPFISNFCTNQIALKLYLQARTISVDVIVAGSLWITKEKDKKKKQD